MKLDKEIAVSTRIVWTPGEGAAVIAEVCSIIENRKALMAAGKNMESVTRPEIVYAAQRKVLPPNRQRLNMQSSRIADVIASAMELLTSRERHAEAAEYTGAKAEAENALSVASGKDSPKQYGKKYKDNLAEGVVDDKVVDTDTALSIKSQCLINDAVSSLVTTLVNAVTRDVVEKLKALGHYPGVISSTEELGQVIEFGERIPEEETKTEGYGNPDIKRSDRPFQITSDEEYSVWRRRTLQGTETSVGESVESKTLIPPVKNTKGVLVIGITKTQSRAVTATLLRIFKPNSIQVSFLTEAEALVQHSIVPRHYVIAVTSYDMQVDRVREKLKNVPEERTTWVSGISELIVTFQKIAKDEGALLTPA